MDEVLVDENIRRLVRVEQAPGSRMGSEKVGTSRVQCRCTKLTSLILSIDNHLSIPLYPTCPEPQYSPL